MNEIENRKKGILEQPRKLCKQLTNFRIEINERAFFQLTKPLSNRIPFPSP